MTQDYLHAGTKPFGPATAKVVRTFFPDKTPLVNLPELAKECGTYKIRIEN